MSDTLLKICIFFFAKLKLVFSLGVPVLHYDYLTLQAEFPSVVKVSAHSDSPFKSNLFLIILGWIWTLKVTSIHSPHCKLFTKQIHLKVKCKDIELKDAKNILKILDLGNIYLVNIYTYEEIQLLGDKGARKLESATITKSK